MPDRIDERTVTGNIPYGKAGPGPSRHIHCPRVLMVVEGRRRLQIDEVTMSVLSVPPYDLSDTKRKSRRYLCTDPDAAIAHRGDRAGWQKDLTRSDEAISLLNRPKDLVVVIERGQLRHSQIVDIHMAVQLVCRTDLKYILLCDHVLVQAEIIDVVKCLEGSLAQPRR